MKHERSGLLLLSCVLLLYSGPSDAAATIRIGSKQFTESHVLAEMTAQLLEKEGIEVERKFGLGGTLIVYQALRSGDIDLYPEYSGTISQTILKRPGLNRLQLDEALEQQRLVIAAEFGFNNSYAIAIDGELARRENISKISQLAAHPDLKLAFSLEFLNRADGWPALSRHYQLTQSVSGLEHALAYRAMASGQLNVTDAYSTDGELGSFDLVLLEDDRQFFPRYDATLLARADLSQTILRSIRKLDGSLDEITMRRLNARASEPGVSPAQVIAGFTGDPVIQPGRVDVLREIMGNVFVHLKLTGIALLLASALAIPLGLLLSQHVKASATVLYIAGLLQTIPSLALLALLIPVLGLGQLTAIVALFMYSLLPILRNTLSGLSSVDPLLRQIAEGMGLSRWQRLREVEIPLALPTILAGVKTAAIISIGTATLAAFVGAGGLGEPIITGLTLNDHQLILRGAIPAAVLAIATEFLFEWLERTLVPGHLLERS